MAALRSNLLGDRTVVSSVKMKQSMFLAELYLESWGFERGRQLLKKETSGTMSSWNGVLGSLFGLALGLRKDQAQSKI